MNIIGGGESEILSIDKIISYPLAKKIAPILHNFNITANQITIFNIFFRIYILYDLYYYNSVYIIYFLILTHFIDCLDGTVARMYNQQTKFGAMLDEWSDKIFFCILVLIILYKSNNNLLKIIVVVFLIIYGLIHKICIDKKKCNIHNFLQNNLIILLIILYYIYKKLI